MMVYPQTSQDNWFNVRQIWKRFHRCVRGPMTNIFSAMKNTIRHDLLQDKPSSGYSLRERVHNFVLTNRY